MLIGHPIFWLLAAAVVAPLLAEIPLGFKVPVVVLEVMLGIVIGPYVLGLAQFEGFVVTKFTLAMATTLLVPAFGVLFLVIRGAPVFLYRREIAMAQRLPFALSSAVPSLSIIVVITEIGVRAKTMNPDVAAALVGAALLSVLLFPTIAGVLLGGTKASSPPDSRPELPARQP